MSSHVMKITSWHNIMPSTKNQISPRIRAAWSVSSLPAWRNVASLVNQNTLREDSDQTAWMHRLRLAHICEGKFSNIAAHIYEYSQRAHDVNTTSPQRRCKVMTLHRRWGDVVFTSCACRVTTLLGISAYNIAFSLKNLSHECSMWNLSTM